MKLRFPIVLLLVELVAWVGLDLLELPHALESIVNHGLIVLIIATLGWLACGIVTRIYHNVRKGPWRKRALLTQILFVYRIAIFAIVAVTLAAILMSFPYIRNLGLGIMGSAGIAGIALGIAARPILLNLMAGFQIAATKTIQIGDNLVFDGESGKVESIHLTHIILKTWDLRRIIVPISQFIDKPFQNWDTITSELTSPFFLHCDYRTPVEVIRNKVGELLEQTPYWNKKSWNVHVTNLTAQTMEVRIYASANNPPESFELLSFLREKLVAYLQEEYPEALPTTRQIIEKV